MITLSRRYHFSASHRLHSPQLSDAENARLYGKCNNPYGHGHNYILEIGIAGPLDKTTGLLVPVPELDRFVADHILRLLSHRNLNADLPQFAHATPTTENLALVVAAMAQASWPRNWAKLNIRLARVHIQETERNGFELLLARPAPRALEDQKESLLIHA